MTEPIVTITHCKRLGYCAKGMRAFFLRHGLDWQAFRTEGVHADALEATGDAMAIRAAALAREDAQRGEA